MQGATPNDPLYIVEIAPATSLGAILNRNPKLAENCILVAMSGSVYKGYHNSPNPVAEYNVGTDIMASQAMYNATWLTPLVMAPLDTCNFDQWNGDVYQTLLAANNTSHPYVQVLLQNYQIWYDNGGKNNAGMLPFTPATGTDVLYDAQAAWMTGNIISKGNLSPLVMKELPLLVNGQGYTVVDAKNQKNAVNAALMFQTVDQHQGALEFGAEVIKSIVDRVV